MKNILASRYRKLIAQFATAKVLLGFDYDGTLAPLASEPSKAKMRSQTRQLLTLIAHDYPCAIISGRSRESVAKMLQGVPAKYIVGNHGAEWDKPSSWQRKLAELVHQWRATLLPRLCTIKGAVLEDKAYSLTIHYRKARDQSRALAAIANAVRDLPSCKKVLGILSVNLVPLSAPNKGDALTKLCKLSRCNHAVFVGDDITDEDAFAVKNNHQLANLLTIRIGQNASSRANYYVPEQPSINELLRRFHQIRHLC